MLRLVVNPGTPEEQTFPLSVGETSIGRTKENEIFCTHRSLSRKHAKLEFDGKRLRLTDLQSKNGIHFGGRRVTSCNLADGDVFRCGDITFLVEGATSRTHRLPPPVETLQSPLTRASAPSTSGVSTSAGASRPKKSARGPAERSLVSDQEERHKTRVSMLVRATEVLVRAATVEAQLEELAVLAVQMLEVDRIAILSIDGSTLQMNPRAIKTFVNAAARPYSKRVVDWIIDRGSAAMLADVSRDKALPGDMAEDAKIRGAMCAPVNPGGGTIGVVYCDSLSRANCYDADDLAILRALANLAAMAIEGDALRQTSVPSKR